jgi:Domain of Unknown Function (DUF1206)
MIGTNRQLALLARSGYAARGLVYLVVGGLAVLAALGQGGQTTDTHGALTTLLTQPFGKVLLGLVALGLVAVGVYSLIEAWYRRIDTPYSGDLPERHAVARPPLSLET